MIAGVIAILLIAITLGLSALASKLVVDAFVREIEKDESESN